jgi:predicted LPLAT superfamily acyltransferase
MVTVRGVIDEPTDKSSVNFDVLLSIHLNNGEIGWRMGFYEFLHLAPHFDIDAFNAKHRSITHGELEESYQLVSLRKASHSYVLGMLADQKPSKRSSYAWTTFLNRETAFLNGGELLAKKFGLSAIYAHILCPKRGYYTVRFEAITADPNTMSEDQITSKYAALLEQNIQQQPSQWLWTHNRWKWGRKELEG